MKYNDYRKLYNRLNKPSDIKKISKQSNLDRELLLVLYTQKIVRDATRRFYKVKRHAEKMQDEWRSGRSFLSIASTWQFPPVLTVLIILGENGVSKKQVWKYINKPDVIRNSRLQKEIKEVAKNDIVYSPNAVQLQYERGRWGEKKLKKWLDKQNIKYRTEKQIRGKFSKTPDYLLNEPIRLNDMDVNWIESKANFGDFIEIKRTMKKQLIPYTELFGNGAVVYWFGFLDEVRSYDGIDILDASSFKIN